MEEKLLNDVRVFVLDEEATLVKSPWECKPVLPENSIVKKIDGTVHHLNYVDYLEICWANHYGVVLKPDHLWQIVLCEIGTHVKDNVELYRKLFTDSDQKKNIVINTLEPHVLPLDEVVKQLKNLVPIGIDDFLPSFSTSTEMSQFAFNAAFADAVSPYYNYFMLACGFPKIRLEGEIDDWKKMQSSLKSLKTHFAILNDYFDKVISRVDDVIKVLLTNDATVFKTILKMQRCGSGSQHTVEGWIKEFFFKEIDYALTQNFPSCVSSVLYTNLSTDTDYEMKVGLLSSNVEDGFLVPDFGYAVYEKV
jgi:hypothetical protein